MGGRRQSLLILPFFWFGVWVGFSLRYLRGKILSEKMVTKNECQIVDFLNSARAPYKGLWMQIGKDALHRCRIFRR